MFGNPHAVEKNGRSEGIPQRHNRRSANLEELEDPKGNTPLPASSLPNKDNDAKWWLIVCVCVGGNVQSKSSSFFAPPVLCNDNVVDTPDGTATNS